MHVSKNREGSCDVRALENIYISTLKKRKRIKERKEEMTTLVELSVGAMGFACNEEGSEGLL